MKKKIRALVLFSGGLDSILAVKLLSAQGVAVEAVNFRTNFCGPKEARLTVESLGVPLREVDLRREFLSVLRNPRYGYGAGLNPCLDCRILMLKKAGEIMRAEKFDFIATGEVLGERPMSQRLAALNIVEKDADIVGFLLRPLSAKLLAPTIAEKNGLIDREKLMDIVGRSRHRQMALAKEFSIEKYPSPAGGCPLTQAGFAGRLRALIKGRPDFTSEDIDLTAIGRHFFENGCWLILGRDKTENEFLKSRVGRNDVFVVPLNFGGPEALIRGGEISLEVIERAKKAIIAFAPQVKKMRNEKPFFDIIEYKNREK